MSFTTYPDYKPISGTWFARIPRHWDVLPLGRVTVARCDGPFGSGLKSEHYAASGVRVVRLQNIRATGFDGADEAYIPAEYHAQLGHHDVIPGDILIAGLGDENNVVGRACVAPPDIGPAMVKADCFRFRVDRSKVLPQFVAYVLCAGSTHDAGVLASGSTRSRVPLAVMASRAVLLPPLCEQHAIVTFVDRDMAKIDALVAEQRRLIELLKEKRQVLISRTVTKGLAPGVLLKPSGAPWMGDIPAHWAVVQSRRLFRVRNEPARDSDRQLTASQKYGMVSQTDFVEMEGRRVVEVIRGTDSLRHAEPNDFVISLRSFQGGLEWCKLAGSVTFHYVVLVPIKNIHEPFFAHLFKSLGYIQALRSTANLIRDGQDLRYSHFVLVDLPWVPLDEQVQIASYLDRETTKIDALIADVQLAIANLRERRAALISAAVTGQIDVRAVVRSEVA